MLIDHNNLEEFSDPVNYDVEDASDTGVAFYTALAQETSGPVLEIACGTGRVSIPIARLGFDVTGLDIVPGMLEQARGKAAGLPTRWVEGDRQRFPGFSDERRPGGVVAARAHLHDEGLFAFETRNPLFSDSPG
jgi:SAM-dependent methyltransferase